jgi:hypothetical protein
MDSTAIAIGDWRRNQCAVLVRWWKSHLSSAWYSVHYIDVGFALQNIRHITAIIVAVAILSIHEAPTLSTRLAWPFGLEL